MTPRDLTTLFTPKSVAVLGATERPGAVGEAVFRNLLHNHYQGVVYPINFRAKQVMSVKAAPSLTALGEVVDLAILVVPTAAVLPAIEECGQLGVKNVSVITAGFKEVGGEGIVLENKLKDLVKKYGINLMGPNCLGHINTDPEVSLNASFARRMPIRGNLGFISQSGALCGAILDYAAAKNIGFSKFISFGNKADVSEIDFLNYLSDDPATDVIIMYLEDLVEGRSFIDLAREITGERKKRKPILAIKTGRTAQGAAAAASHTGSLAGSDEVYDALFAQAGVLRVDTVEDLFDYATAFANQPIPKGNRVAILTNAGGPGIMTTDACVRNGLEVPRLSEPTLKALEKALPAMASTKNPVDVVGDALHDRYKAALDVLVTEPNVDSIIVLVTPQNMTDVAEIAEEVAKANEAHKDDPDRKTIVGTFMGSVDMACGADLLKERGVPSYKFPESAVRSLGQMVAYERWLARPRTDVKEFNVDTTKAKSIIDGAIADGRTQLPEIESLELLKSYGFPVPAFGHAADPEKAVAAAEELGYPVVLKISSPDILHKTDVGGVKLNLKDAAAVRAAAKDILETSAKLRPNARIWGVTVEPMSKPGREVILGMTRDPRFGPILMFGLGGVYTELLKDVSFRLAPVRELGAIRMVDSLKTKALFDTFRGTPPADKEAIYDAIERLSQLVVDFPNIKEMDINPMLVYPAGEGAAVVDARIILDVA
ncbi:MAG: acetate--CoA ligase family protein [Capsulimonadaceae bacterium]|nr:acetate--CoA ligase family protein [Capsulimonadaceae bacterium]